MHNRSSRTEWLWTVSLLALAAIFGVTMRAAAQESFAATHFAVLSGNDETPAIPDGGDGIAFIRLDPANNSLEYRITVSLQSSDVITMAHFHRGTTGVSGPPENLITFPAGSHTATGTWTNISAEDMQALLTGGIYMNVHTERNPGGQIRGQVQPVPNFTALRLTASQEVPANSSTGSGTGLFSLDPTASRLLYHIEWDSLSGPPTMAHFHLGDPGVSGPVAHPIALAPGSGATGEADGVWDNMTQEDMANLLAGKFYVNVHTTQNPGGEIRTQVLKTDFFTAAISPANEAPAISGSTMAGTGFVTLATDSAWNGLFIVTDGSGPISMAHIHNGAIGVSGPVVQPLIGIGNLWYLLPLQSTPSEVQAALRSGNLYANFHTSQNPNGEARGQLIAAATNLASAPLAVPVTAPDAASNALTAWYDASSATIRVRTSSSSPRKDTRLLLFSALGEEIGSIALNGDRGEFPAAALPNGVYFVQLLRDGAPAGVGRIAVVR